MENYGVVVVVPSLTNGRRSDSPPCRRYYKQKSNQSINQINTRFIILKVSVFLRVDSRWSNPRESWSQDHCLLIAQISQNIYMWVWVCVCIFFEGQQWYQWSPVRLPLQRLQSVLLRRGKVALIRVVPSSFLFFFFLVRFIMRIIRRLVYSEMRSPFSAVGTIAPLLRPCESHPLWFLRSHGKAMRRLVPLLRKFGKKGSEWLGDWSTVAIKIIRVDRWWLTESHWHEVWKTIKRRSCVGSRTTKLWSWITRLQTAACNAALSFISRSTPETKQYTKF